MFRETFPVHRLCLAMLLAIGFALPYGIAVGLGNEARKVLLRINGRDSYEQVVFMPGGQVLVQTMSVDGRSRRYEYRSLDGTAITGQHNYSRAVSINQFSPEPQEWGKSTGLEQTVRYLASFGSEQWYMVVHRDTLDGLCYFAGFDASNRMPVGYLGVNGFQTERPTEEQMLPVAGSPLSYFGQLPMTWAVGPRNSMQPVALFLLSNGRLLKIEPGRRRMTGALENNDIVGIAEVLDPTVASRASTATGQLGAVVANRILLRTPDSVIRFDPMTDSVQEFALSEELHQQVFQFYPQSNEQAAVVLWTLNEGRRARCDVVFIDRQGNVTERFDDVLQGSGSRIVVAGDSLVVACIVPAPLISFLSTMLIPMDPYVGEDYTLMDAIADGWPAILLTCLVGGVCAFLTVRRQRAWGEPRSMGWGLFVFMLGWPGYVGYLLHRRWPIRERPQSPEPNGLEILA